MNYYYTIIGTSRNTYGGTRYSIGVITDEPEIIGFAHDECAKSGEDLYTLAGICWTLNDDEQFVPERDFEPGEEFQAALTKLNDDGRTYEIFRTDTEAKEFIERAEEVGLGEKANETVEHWER